jgi:hypothetical protein
MAQKPLSEKIKAMQLAAQGGTQATPAPTIDPGGITFPTLGTPEGRAIE